MPTAYAGGRVAMAIPIVVTIVGAAEGQRGLVVHPRHWVTERTFGCLGSCRRLARDHELTPSSVIAFFVLAAADPRQAAREAVLKWGLDNPKPANRPLACRGGTFIHFQH